MASEVVLESWMIPSLVNPRLMEFERRLQRAIERGQSIADARNRELAERELSEEELRQLYSQARLELSEHIESCLKLLADRFPGFEYQSILSEDGWGGRITRDDLGLQRGRSDSFFSRLEMVITPFSSAHIIELVGKGTIRNRKAFHRTQFQRLTQLDVESFREQIDLWVLEFAEKFAAAK